MCCLSVSVFFLFWLFFFFFFLGWVFGFWLRLFGLLLSILWVLGGVAPLRPHFPSHSLLLRIALVCCFFYLALSSSSAKLNPVSPFFFSFFFLLLLVCAFFDSLFTFFLSWGVSSFRFLFELLVFNYFFAATSAYYSTRSPSIRKQKYTLSRSHTDTHTHKHTSNSMNEWMKGWG